jgi:hypothetical protein
MICRVQLLDARTLAGSARSTFWADAPEICFCRTAEVPTKLSHVR